jgi:hypothetical protein
MQLLVRLPLELALRVKYSTKMTRTTTLCFFLTYCCLIAACPVVADEVAEAKAKIEEGKRLVTEENYQAALEAFEASYALRPKTWVLFNIGMCQKALHRYADAIATFNRYLSLEKKTEQAHFKTLELALQAVDELEQLVGKVNIVEAPDGARVVIDGTKVGKTPLSEPLVLDPGRHALKIKKPGFQALEIDVIVNSGAEVEVRGSLEQPKAEIKVECKGAENQIFIDEVQVGNCPFKGEVDSGEHRINVVGPGKESYETTVDAAAGSTIVMAVELKPDQKQMEPPTFVDKPPDGQEDRPGIRQMRVSGIASATLGAVILGVGGVLTSRWNKELESAEETQRQTNDANSPDNFEAWSGLYNRYNKKAEKVENLQAGYIASYAVGGGLVLLGTILIVLDVAHDADENATSIVPTANGVALRF